MRGVSENAISGVRPLGLSSALMFLAALVAPALGAAKVQNDKLRDLLFGSNPNREVNTPMVSWEMPSIRELHRPLRISSVQGKQPCPRDDAAATERQGEGFANWKQFQPRGEHAYRFLGDTKHWSVPSPSGN